MSFQFRIGLLVLGALLVTACGGGSGGGGGAATGNEGPAVVSASPIEATGASQTLALEFSHPAGADKILIVQLMIAPNLSTPKSCWIELALADGTVKMMDGSGQAKAGEPGSVSNAACTIDAAQLKQTVAGNSLKVSVPVQLKPAVRDTQNIFALASAATQHSGWKPVGTWTREGTAK